MKQLPHLTCTRYAAVFALAAVLTTTAAQTAQAVPACDDRIAIDNPVRFPFETIAALRYDNDYDGDFESRGSGAVVGPHMVLTCGHCVYNRDNGVWNDDDIYIAPAMYQDNTNTTVYPFGTRIASEKRTNTKWTDQNYSPESDVDYGSLGFVCPFEDLTTYIPLVFDYEPGFVNMSGYPTEDLPDTSRSRDQWRGAGDVTDTTDRKLTYDVRSTGGASGAPVWEYQAPDERRLIAVNRGHSTECNGLGPRLVWQNENLILTWLEWQPTLFEQNAAGCVELVRTSWDALNSYFNSHRAELMSLQDLRLVEPIPGRNVHPVRRVVQVIENTLYFWEEYALDANAPNGPRYLRMLKPEPHWLSVEEAQVLLSASRRWTEQPASGKYTTYGPPASEPGIRSRLTRDDDHGAPDRVRDASTTKKH